MLAVIVIEAGFMQRGAIIDDQQVALFILVRIRGHRKTAFADWPSGSSARSGRFLLEVIVDSSV